MSKESVLSRWSRRKRQAKRGEPDLESANSPPTEAGAGNSPVATEPDIGAEELARLPRIEDLTAHSDLMQFLRKGVPVALRNAALRRVWALDPKIRDYVGEARDYAYDWNAPAGVPGSGPLDERDIEGLLRRVIGDAEPCPSPAPPQPAPGPGIPCGAEASTEAPPPSGKPSPAEPDRSAGPETPPEAAPAGRRHGGAMPV